MNKEYCVKCGTEVKNSWKYCPMCGVFNPQLKDGLVFCEACKKSFLKQGYKNHIINKAKAEISSEKIEHPHFDILNDINKKFVKNSLKID
jgi:hypothetical protein